jgi:cold shock protein
MPVGQIKWFNNTKGFGFIKPEGGGADVFVHITALESAGLRSTVGGSRFSFEVELNQRSGKPCAVNLKSVDIPASGL